MRGEGNGEEEGKRSRYLINRDWKHAVNQFITPLLVLAWSGIKVGQSLLIYALLSR